MRKNGHGLLGDYQHSPGTGAAGTIEINPNACWDSSWGHEDPYGCLHLTSALLRHTAHILGFGASISRTASGTCQFAIPGTPSAFDNIVTNGTTTLGSLAAGATAGALGAFLAHGLRLKAGGTAYPLYSSAAGYVPFRTACHFALPSEDLMGSQYGFAKQLPISQETLAAIESVGWEAKPHSLGASATGLDTLGYGSLYLPHTSSATDTGGNPIGDAQWTYQLYNGATGEYETAARGHGAAFTVTPRDMGAGYADEFSSQQARLLCEATANGAHLQRAYTVCLESRPLLVGYSVYNVRQCADPNYLEFDAKVRCAGATGGYLAIANAGTAFTHGMATDSVTVVEGTRIHKDYHTSLGVTLTNPYGTTSKAVPLGGQLAAQPTDGIEAASAAPGAPSRYSPCPAQGCLRQAPETCPRAYT